MAARSLYITAFCLLLGCASESATDLPPAETESPQSAPSGVVSAAEREFYAGIEAFEHGDYSDALTRLDASLAAGGGPRVQLVRACMLLFSRRFEEASARLEELSDDPSLTAGVSVARGHLAINERDYERAHQLLAVGMEPVPVRDQGGVQPTTQSHYAVFVYELACLGMGWSEANRNQHVRAISWFDRILSGQDDDQLAMIGKANSLIGLGLLGDAEKLLTRVLAAHPGNPYALAELAMIRMGRGDDEAAEQGFRQALQRDGSNYTCPYEGLGLLYLRQGRTDEAKEHLARAIDINPNIEFRKYNGLARIYITEGNYDEARKLLEKSIENFPHDGEAGRMLAEIEELRARP